MHYLVKYYQDIIEHYDGTLPLIHYLKSFFAQHKQLGKRDRKALTDATFIFYRTLAVHHLNELHPLKVIQQYYESLEGKHYWKFLFEHRISETTFQEFLFQPEKLPIRNNNFIFSKGMDQEKFDLLLSQQPHVFFRLIHPPQQPLPTCFKETILSVGIKNIKVFQTAQETKLLDFFSENEFIIQDLNSHQVLTKALSIINKDKTNLIFDKVWDACAGAGGKTLLLQELIQANSWRASDIRSGILKEFQRRQKLYHRKVDQVFKLNMTVFDFNHQDSVDLMVLDVPCSGSGTWGRTPERRTFFSEKELQQWTNMQTLILQNAAQAITKNGYIIYMTCSVFKEENEDIIHHFLKNNPDFVALDEQLLIGMHTYSDSLYMHVLKHKSC